jgi:hypothetical protein
MLLAEYSGLAKVVGTDTTSAKGKEATNASDFMHIVILDATSKMGVCNIVHETAETAKAETAKAETAKAETAKAETAETAKAGTAKATTAKAKTAKADTSMKSVEDKIASAMADPLQMSDDDEAAEAADIVHASLRTAVREAMSNATSSIAEDCCDGPETQVVEDTEDENEDRRPEAECESEKKKARLV